MIYQATRFARIRPFVVSGLSALAYCSGLLGGLGSLASALGLNWLVDSITYAINKIAEFVRSLWSGVKKNVVDPLVETAGKLSKELGAMLKAAVEAITSTLAALGVSAQSIASSIVLAVLMYVAIKLLT